MLKERVVGFGLENQTEAITLNILVTTRSNIKMVFDFILKSKNF